MAKIQKIPRQARLIAAISVLQIRNHGITWLADFKYYRSSGRIFLQVILDAHDPDKSKTVIVSGDSERTAFANFEARFETNFSHDPEPEKSLSTHLYGFVFLNYTKP